MELTGTQKLPAVQDAVWSALNDPEMLKRCIPGCQRIELIAENEYQMDMIASVGPIKAKFQGKLTVSDVVPPQSYSIDFEGSGGVAGFGKGHTEVTLGAEGNETLLTYTASAQVGGKIAQLGARLINGVAAKLADAFFKKFKEEISETSAHEITPEGS
ncbi:carbon monoxide dehydrogenase subunit G [Paraburkholderia sp. LEh10]|uniref:SRPBCC family protein n=1 Tax=Paraburkholderia sp. LEh10 TaxID=2821353 RepID=UPI001AE4D9D2|nr:carbon monoxide dehydrogenase subunit G [Paraburkholderia sp. LEh10]MBP0590391.1 carbon monoxide dehydrogenase subunit G [Paraburkholderia sp. LEh10]